MPAAQASGIGVKKSGCLESSRSWSLIRASSWLNRPTPGLTAAAGFGRLAAGAAILIEGRGLQLQRRQPPRSICSAFGWPRSCRAKPPR